MVLLCNLAVTVEMADCCLAAHRRSLIAKYARESARKALMLIDCAVDSMWFMASPYVFWNAAYLARKGLE